MTMDKEVTGWNVLRTRSRQENVVEECLMQKQIAVYLPKLPRVRRWKSRNKVVDFPLFPGYIFVKPRPDQFQALNFIPGSCGLLLDRNRPGIVQKREIDSIRILLGSERPMDLHLGLLPGTRVRVMVGPLAGIEGEMVRFSNHHRLVINAHILGQAVSVEVNTNEVTEG